ncbi:MAG: YhdP family protein [Proteobacteria bacterium]|nr:YhdP family protein [Pseudomonadota bacterium]
MALTWLCALPTRPSMDNDIKPLPTLTAHPILLTRLRRPARLLMWLALLAYFGFALVFLSLRYVVLPQVNDYHVDIERMLSDSLRLPVAIAAIDAQWQGLRPQLALHGFQVHDRQGRPAMMLDDVTAEISWTSLLHLGLRLHRLEIAGPSLTIRRDAQGQVFVAGLQVTAPSQENQNDFSDWLLAQQRVVVRDASITWVDEQRGAPPLELQHLNFHLQNDGSRHRFGLTADPPKALAARLDIRGDFNGQDLDELAAWKGDAYAELDYADLAIWRTWIDYPLDLPQGSGGIRLWLGFAQKRLTDATADIALANVKLRLAQDLPVLDLQSLNGRLAGKRLAHGMELGARRLALTTSDGIVIQPTDFQLKWSGAADALPAGGTFSAQDLDLDAFARLAAYLPLDNEVRRQVAEVAPRGKLIEMKSAWGFAKAGRSAPLAPTGVSAPVLASDVSGLVSYSLQARFERLGMQAIGMLPGFDGVSGNIAVDEQGGSLTLASQQAAVDLPRIFADPHLVLQTLNAHAGWNIRNENGRSRVDIKLDNLAFESHDAAGGISGSYIGRGGEPGEIDLSARLTRASGTAVWRYMPLVVHHDVADWLRASILAGTSNDTTLRLKGDLKRFPFADGSGVFEVKGRFTDGALQYAADWPRIERITGELEFVGKRMLIKASRGSIYGVSLSDVKAEISDLASGKAPLLISGKAAGFSSEFLRFIESSPVGEHIDHFTEDMKATGNGQLNLKLSLPLGHLADTRTEGVYQFASNQLTLDADLPPLSDVNGRLQFSGDGLKADKVRATLLGSPLVVDVKTVGNGTVLVNAEGSLSVAELRKQWAHPLLDHLSGSTTWRGSVRVRKKNAELVLESRLQGISSSLPEPFNKSASETQLLRFERKQAAEPPRIAAPPARRGAVAAPVAPVPPRDQIDVTLGNALAARLVRRREGQRAENAVLERGAIAIGEALVLPDRGLLLSVNQKKVDVDFWRRLMVSGTDGKTGGAAAGRLPKLDTSVALKAQEFIVFGQNLNDLEIKAATTSPANVREAGWRVEVNSRELVGILDWRNLGAGRLSGHLKKLAINETTGAKPVDDQVGRDQMKEMPGLDIEADQFLLSGKPVGKLKLVADNRDGTWDARLDIDNDDGKLSGEGQWRPSMTQPDTHLKFTLNVKSVEKLLARLGYPDALRRGTARLEGILSWNGAPSVIDYPSLSGMLEVQASNGQFVKGDPGVGRLLGILSLQSLPRRITLDFRDIFSEGFAFDNISAKLNLTRGIMDTRDFLMQGPAAKVLMSGTVNLPQESVNLKVRISPALTETFAVGAMLSHPAAGAIAWLADKILKNPLDQIFAYDYAVTGNWADPKVEKISGRQPNENAEKPN